MTEINFEQLRNFLEGSFGGCFTVNGRKMKDLNLPIAHANILTRIPEKGLDISVIESEGGMVVGPDPEGNKFFDWIESQRVSKYLEKMLGNGLVKERKGIYKTTMAARYANYEYHSLDGVSPFLPPQSYPNNP